MQIKYNWRGMLLNQELTFVVLGLIFAWLAMISYYLYRLAAHYHKLTAGVGRGNLSSLLEKVIKGQEHLGKRLDELTDKTETLEKDGLSHVQRLGLVRFNPFSETGGDQSFTLAVLDGEKSGVVMSSLHNRNATRIYAKPVKTGKVQGYQSSKEEMEAIEKAS